MNKYFKYLIIALAASAIPLAVNRLIMPVPDWLYILFIIISAASLVTYIVKTLRMKKK